MSSHPTSLQDVQPLADASTAPVHGTPFDKDQPQHGIALSLSGGGYRAMLFHLGSVWRLNEIGLLEKLARVSSVSGGSIMAGVLAAYWSKRPNEPVGNKKWFETEIVSRIREMASTTIDWKSVAEGAIPFMGTVSEHIASQYDKHLFAGKTLQDLPDSPNFVINATSLQSGVLWRFSKPYMGDWKVGRFAKPKVKLATAVAASSAFPPFLSPAEIDLANCVPIDDPAKPPVLTDPKYRHKAILSDGGVYDNLGLETTFKSYDTLLVSDGGGILEPQTDPSTDWPQQTYRVLNVIDNQVGSLRKRQLMAAYNGQRKGTFWGIRTNIADYKLADALQCPVSVTIDLAATPTRLAALDDQKQEMLIEWGYAVCDAAIRRYFPQPNATVPAQSPYGHFKQPLAATAATGPSR